MKRYIPLATLCFLLSAPAALAQMPRITAELEASETIVGQPLVLELKILVPTWLPKPPVFPDLEMPSLMVRLPEGASGPISERIDGETWSGIQRRYRLYPLSGGTFTLPAGEITVTYADPDASDPVVHKENLPKTTFSATVPAGAKGVSPPIIASGFALEQTLEGETGLAVGDAFTRTLVASIDGTTPVLIPQLTPIDTPTGLRGYPKDPAVTETEDRGDLSGTRSEVTTYVAQSGGRTLLPAVSFDWFNIETGAVETVLVPQVDLTVTGEAASADEPLDPANIARMIAWALIGIGIFWTVARLLGPRIADGLAKLRAAWRGSELCAYRAVAEAMRHRDLNSTMAALADWLTFFPQATAVHQGALESALATIGSARYGSGTDGTAVANWSGLRDVYDTTRRQLRALRRTRENDESLPPMNPYST